MTMRARLRRLGGDGGPRVTCPSCAGTGRVYDADGPRQFWVVECRVAQIRAQRTAEQSGEPYVEPDLPPEPEERPQVCPTCRGAGEAAESAARISAFDDGVDVVGERVARIKQQAAARRAAAGDAEHAGTPSLLRAVPDEQLLANIQRTSTRTRPA